MMLRQKTISRRAFLDAVRGAYAEYSLLDNSIILFGAGLRFAGVPLSMLEAFGPPLEDSAGRLPGVLA